METINAQAYFKSNTCYRFISQGKTAFKISLPKPEGGYFYRTVGFVKIGEEKALKKAIIERNKQGKKLWGKFWHRVVSDWTLLARLPRNLEPRLVTRPLRSKKAKAKQESLPRPFFSTKQVDAFNFISNLNYEVEYVEYRANWNEYIDGGVVKKARRYSCSKHGKLGAYILAKQALINAHKKHLSLLQFMGRASRTNLS